MTEIRTLPDQEAKELAERLLNCRSANEFDKIIANRVLDAVTDGRAPKMTDKTALRILDERYL